MRKLELTLIRNTVTKEVVACNLINISQGYVVQGLIVMGLYIVQVTIKEGKTEDSL